MKDKIICDTQAEAGVIATLICHPEFIFHSDYLKPRYFYNMDNACIYWAISELYKQGIDTIDAFNITNMFNSNAAVKKKISEYNLSDMQQYIAMSQYAARHTIEEYKLLVNNVVSASFKRELAKVSNEINSECFDPEMTLSKLNTLVNNKISKLTEKYLITDEIEI